MASMASMQISAALAQKCRVALEALDVEALDVTDGCVDVPIPQEATRHQQALPFLESWATASHSGSWFRDAVEAHGASVNDQLMAARQAADYLDCRDFLVQTARLSLLFLHQLRRDGFKELSSGSWPPFHVQFSQQVLAELEDLDLAGEQLAIDHLGPDRYIPPDLFHDTVDRLDSDGTLCLDPVTIRSVITWLGFQLAVYGASYEETFFWDADHPYVTVQLPLQLLRRFRVASVLVTAKAHDQGWSSYPEDRGTTNNSWTFADLAVCSSQQPADQAPLHCHERVYTNRHATADWQEHSTTLGADTELVRFVNDWADAQPAPPAPAPAPPPPPDGSQRRGQQAVRQRQARQAQGQGGEAAAGARNAGPSGDGQGQQAQPSGWQHGVRPLLQRLAGMVAGAGPGAEPSTSEQGASEGGVRGATRREVGGWNDDEGPGLVVQLRLRALYPGWMHYVQRGSVLVALEHRT